MKKSLITILSVFLFVSSGFAKTGFEGRPIVDNIFIPTGYTLNKGEFILGIGPIAYGISNRIQIGTNLLYLLDEEFYSYVKFNLIKTGANALAVGLKVNFEKGLTAFSPYAVFSTKISKNMLLHIGGQYRYSSSKWTYSGTSHLYVWEETSVNFGIEQNISKKTKLLAETNYDIDDKQLRISGAVLFGWKKFRLALGLSYYHPYYTKVGDLFKTHFWPVINLWWRL